MALVYAVVALIIVVVAVWLSTTYIPMPPALKVALNVVLGLIVVGIVLWAIDTYIPMAGAIRGLLNVVVFLAACVGVLQAFGLWDSVTGLWTNWRSRRMVVPRNEEVPQRH